MEESMVREVLLPVRQSYDEKSDCGLSAFSSLLSYYGISYSAGQVLFLSSGLDLNYRVSRVNGKGFLVTGGRKENVDEIFSEGIGVRFCRERFDTYQDNSKELAQKDWLSRICQLLSNGIPVLVNLDRYYLDYLMLKRAHMPFHTVLLAGYSLDKQEVYALDMLVQQTVIPISFDTLKKAGFAESVLKEKEYGELKYLDLSCHTDIKEIDEKKALNKQADYYCAPEGVCDQVIQLSDYLENLYKRVEKNGSTEFNNYYQFQLYLFYSSMLVAFDHRYYRELYFEELLKTQVNLGTGIMNIQREKRLIWKLYGAWDELLEKREPLHRCLRKTNMIEREIFELAREGNV